jgi:hypothetical protein
MAPAPGIFEKLVMPGPLIGADAEQEKTCKRQEPFAQQSQFGLCLGCHQPIAADRQAKTKHHGRHPEALKAECKHAEHKGRTFDIVRLNRKTFNHSFANFTLTGSHKRASSDGCHVKNTKYRETPGCCVDRHRSIDPHKGRLGEECEGCPGEEAWRRVKTFDHGKTRFALVGQLGAACKSCHKEMDWRHAVACDHDLTRSPLIRLHAAACEAWHRTPSSKDASRACASCHKQGHHTGRATCHNPNGWSSRRFYHDSESGHLLTIAHRALVRHACHRASAAAKISVSSPCYGQEDVHDGAFGRACEKYHTTPSLSGKD